MTDAPQMPLKGIEAILFDLDGTLIDAFGDLAAATNRTRERYGFQALTETEVRRHIGHGTRNLVAQTVPVAPEDLAAAHEFFIRSYDEHLTDRTVAYPHVSETLEVLSRRTLGVVSNKPSRQVRRLFEHFGWLRHFSLVLGADALPMMKPHPEPIRECLRQTGFTRHQAVIVGDSLVDLEAGRRGGIRTIAVTYGNTPHETLATGLPNAFLNDFSDLVALLD